MDSRQKKTLWNHKATSRRTSVTGLINNRIGRLNGADEDFDAKKLRVSRSTDFNTPKDRNTAKDKQFYARLEISHGNK